MKTHRSPAGTRMVLTAMLAAALLAGCQSTRNNLVVHAMPNQQVAGLDAQDTVNVLRYAGFTDLQIVDVAKDVRNSLALQGAARVVMDKKVQALLSVDGPFIYVVSRTRGSFAYNYQTNVVR